MTMRVSHPSGAAFGGVYDPYGIHPGKPMHIDTLQACMETEEYQRVRTMLTSLAPRRVATRTADGPHGMMEAGTTPAGRPAQEEDPRR